MNSKITILYMLDNVLLSMPHACAVGLLLSGALVADENDELIWIGLPIGEA